MPTRELFLIQTAFNVSTWLLWAVLTVSVGYVIIIAMDPGFGTTADLWKCFFWALGLQVAGQQMQQLTPGSVNSAMSISIPK
jgi:hypothetical protein